MGVVKNKSNKKDVANGKTKTPKKVDDNTKVKKKKKVSCLQCIKPMDDGGLEGKYRVAAPELMQDTFMSDSEDEGGEVECPIQQQQQYRYMNSEAGTLHRARPLEDSVTDGHLWPSNNDKKVATIDRQPTDIGFLVSFVVDARGGAMKAKRRGGVRIVVPPAACAAPTRVTCRAATRRAPVAAPPPLMEGEALASRLLELQPQGAKFLAPVIIEVPIFTASCREREIVILRSDTGETWQDHYLHHNDNPMIQEALAKERLEHGPTGETLGENGERVTRIVTCDFPHYLAVVSRVRQEVHIIGPEGGTVSSAAIPQVQALFPPSALTKRIRVGLQAHGAGAELAKRVLPRSVAVSPVITVEPRRRKFHRSITLTAPLPAAQGGEKQSSSNLRLLCSIMGGQARAVWEDVTGSTPLTLTGDCASFTTTVSARFWLMNCQNVSDATKQATELYREMLLVPFEVRLVVLGKRLDSLEGRLLVLYITDRYAYETLLQQEHYVEVAHSTAVRFADGKEVYLEFSGNLLPVTKCGSQPMFKFEAFKDNRVEFPVRVKHHEEKPSGRVYFMSEPKVPKGEQSQTPACVLDVELPERIAPRAGKSQADCLNLDQSGFDALNDELSATWGEHSIGPPSLPHEPRLNGHDKHITNGDVKPADIKDPKPQANGGTVHVDVDSNKTRATFDSDEDRTPHNTLEKGDKGKGKKDGSFLGGLADKVKNVFSHDDDDEQKTKESSPKPQPKPRDNKSQEKDKESPKTKSKETPKPAPRLIKEDLLDKVEDMFKDLQHKPKNHDDEDLASEVYSTKLIVDDNDRPTLTLGDIKEEMYENMQAVDTPACNKKKDPFEFYTGCCEGRFKPGQKHRHDETSNLVDRIEQETFSQKEKLSELGDRVQNDLDDGLDKIQKEKDNVKQKSNEVIEGLTEKSEKVKQDLQKQGHGLLADAKQGFDHLEFLANEQAHTAAHLAQDGVDKAKGTAKDTVDHVSWTTSAAKDDLKDKAHRVEFDVKEKANEVGHDLKNKAQHASNAVADSAHAAEANLSQKAKELKDGAKNAAENVKDDVSETVENVKKSAKEKKKKGKGFISGFVNNIFGEKDKLESEVKGKLAEGKDQANDLLNQASAKKDEVKETVSKKQEELKGDAEHLVQNVQDKKDEVVSKVQNKTNEVVSQVQDKKDEVVSKAQETKDELVSKVQDKTNEAISKAQETKDEVVSKVQNTTNEVVNQVQGKKDELVSKAQATKDEAISKTNEAVSKVQDKKDELQAEAESRLESIRREAEQTTDEIKRSAEDALNSAADKKAELQSNVQVQFSEYKDQGNEALQRAQSGIADRLGSLEKSSKDSFEAAQDAALSTFGKLENTAKDRAREAQDTFDDLQSTTRDTYAGFQDDVHGLESSAQDTLRSFQSSAGNTFDSLDDSAREVFGGIQTTTQNVGDNSRELFGEAKDSFEGFQVSADNKLEDFKESTKHTLEQAGDRLSETKESLLEGARGTAKGVEEGAKGTAEALAGEGDQFTSNLNNLGSEVFGLSGKGFMKDSSSKLLESEKSQSSPSPNKKGSGIPKLKKKKK